MTDAAQGPAIKESSFQHLVIEAMVAVMLVDNRIYEEEIDSILEECDRVMGRHVTRDRIEEIISRGEHREIAGRIGQVRGSYSAADWEALIGCACCVASADNDVHPYETEFITNMAEAAGLQEAVVTRSFDKLHAADDGGSSFLENLRQIFA